ncbi:MAG: hypothetical protein PVG24_13065 [Gammaproteobacteria bacterium]|jgi:hypothetical protein
MKGMTAVFLCAVLASTNVAVAQQEIVTLKAAIVALTDDERLRAEFEDSLAALARENNYDAVASYRIVADVDDVERRRFARDLREAGIGAVLMMRPAAIGQGSSLAAVRDAVSPQVYTNMRDFAGEVSPSAGDDLVAVVHLGIYLLNADGPELLSAGAVWLDEAAGSQQESIDRLQNLVLANVDAVRGPIRQHLGLPPLE